MLSRRDKYTRCYEDARRLQPGLRGRVHLKATIDPTGQVVAVAQAKNTVSEAVGQCLSEKIRAWRFPKPDAAEPVQTLLPFVFSGRRR